MIFPTVSTFWPKLIALGAVLAAVSGGVLFYGHKQYESGRLEEREGWQEKQAIEQAQAMERGHAIAQAHQEIVHDTQEQISKANLDRDVATAASGRLRQQLAAYVQAGRAAAATQGSEAAGDSIGVLGRLLSESDEMAGEYAAVADASRIAGTACERAYTALSAEKSQDGGRMDR